MVRLLYCAAVRSWVILVLSAALPLAAEDSLLDRAKHHVADRLATTLDFTCLLEIERASFRTATSRSFQSRDRTRLEVSVVDGRELFAWPGEEFEERSLTDFLGPGLSSTGEFSSHGGTVFLDRRTSIQRAAEQPRAGHVVYEYSVPVEASRYDLLVTGGPRVTSPYEGLFHVNEASAQVVRFELSVPRPPPASRIARIAAAIDYAPVEVSGATSWLPSEASIEAESPDGPVARNHLGFRSCRSFQTESTISFGGADEAVAGGDSAATAPPIPAGLELLIELKSSISSDRSWAGDRFDAVLYKPLKSDGGLLVPKGAKVAGRVVRIETVDNTPSASEKGRPHRITAITLQLAAVRWESHCAPLSATLRLVERMPLMGRVEPGGRATVDRSHYSTNRAATYDSGEGFSDPGLGTFVVLGELYLVREGTRMSWTTEAGPAVGCKERAR